MQSQRGSTHLGCQLSLTYQNGSFDLTHEIHLSIFIMIRLITLISLISLINFIDLIDLISFIDLIDLIQKTVIGCVNKLIFHVDSLVRRRMFKIGGMLKSPTDVQHLFSTQSNLIRRLLS